MLLKGTVRWEVNRCHILEFKAGAHFGWVPLLHDCLANGSAAHVRSQRVAEARAFVADESWTCRTCKRQNGGKTTQCHVCYTKRLQAEIDAQAAAAAEEGRRMLAEAKASGPPDDPEWKFPLRGGDGKRVSSCVAGPAVVSEEMKVAMRGAQGRVSDHLYTGAQVMTMSRANFDRLIRADERLMKRLAFIAAQRNKHVKWMCYSLMGDAHALIQEVEAVHDGTLATVAETRKTNIALVQRKANRAVKLSRLGLQCELDEKKYIECRCWVINGDAWRLIGQQASAVACGKKAVAAARGSGDLMMELMARHASGRLMGAAGDWHSGKQQHLKALLRCEERGYLGTFAQEDLVAHGSLIVDGGRGVIWCWHGARADATQQRLAAAVVRRYVEGLTRLKPKAGAGSSNDYAVRPSVRFSLTYP